MKAKLLLVEDDESNRLTLSVLLEEEGYHVDVAASFAEAKSMIVAASGYAAILLDQHLGDGLGLHLLPTIRQELPAAKTILVSGSLPEAEWAASGVDAMVAKAAPFPETLDVIERALASIES